MLAHSLMIDHLSAITDSQLPLENTEKLLWACQGQQSYQIVGGGIQDRGLWLVLPSTLYTFSTLKPLVPDLFSDNVPSNVILATLISLETGTHFL